MPQKAVALNNYARILQIGRDGDFVIDKILSGNYDVHIKYMCLMAKVNGADRAVLSAISYRDWEGPLAKPILQGCLTFLDT